MSADLTEMLPQAGAQFAAFRIDKQIGRGGFARIFRAHHADGRVCALKILTPEAPPPNLYSDELVARFEREALVLRGIDTPYAVKLFDFGRSESGLLFMVFEYLEGQTVAEMLLSGPVPREVVLQVVPQLLMALATVHGAGLLHRDIKPSNLMICRTAQHPHHMKLIDFGIAKAYDVPMADEQNFDLTAHGEAIGTPRYMPPERILGRPAGPSSDLYSLACTLSEMLTGKRLVDGDDPVEVVRRHLSDQVLDLPASLHVPESLERALRQMLQKNPKDRPQSAAEVLTMLADDAVFGTTMGDDATTGVSESDVPEPRPRRASALRILAVVLAAMLVFVAVVELPLWTVPFAGLALVLTAMRL